MCEWGGEAEGPVQASAELPGIGEGPLNRRRQYTPVTSLAFGQKSSFGALGVGGWSGAERLTGHRLG